jgi:hypothetical protein
MAARSAASRDETATRLWTSESDDTTAPSSGARHGRTVISSPAAWVRRTTLWSGWAPSRRWYGRRPTATRSPSKASQVTKGRDTASAVVVNVFLHNRSQRWDGLHQGHHQVVGCSLLRGHDDACLLAANRPELPGAG